MSPPIRPPHGIKWCSIPVLDLHIEDELCGDIGLFSQELMGLHPSFVCLIKFHLISYLMSDYALNHCKKLRRLALCQSDGKRVFTDYGKQVTYTCVGPQPSRISNTILDSPSFVNALPQPQWEKLVWLMKLKKFSSIVDKSSALSSDFLVGLHLDQMYSFVVTQTPTSQ